MTCEEIAAKSELFRSGELPTAEALVFEQHLGRCATCQANYEETSEFDTGLREVFSTQPLSTENVITAFHRAVQNDTATAPKIFKLPQAAWKIAAAVALLGIVGFAWLRFQQNAPYRASIRTHATVVNEILSADDWTLDTAQQITFVAGFGVNETKFGKLAIPGYRLQGVREISLAASPYLHFLFDQQEGNDRLSAFFAIEPTALSGKTLGCLSGGYFYQYAAQGYHMAAFEQVQLNYKDTMIFVSSQDQRSVTQTALDTHFRLMEQSMARNPVSSRNNLTPPAQPQCHSPLKTKIYLADHSPETPLRELNEL